MVKLFITFFLSLFCSFSYAKTETRLGGLTYHYFTKNEYSGCIGGKKMCRTIINPLIDVGNGKIHGFIGGNSVGHLMAGIRFNHDLYTHNELKIKVTYGLYYQDPSKFKERNIPVYQLGPIMPTGGIDISYKNMGTLITPVLSVIYLKF